MKTKTTVIFIGVKIKKQTQLTTTHTTIDLVSSQLQADLIVVESENMGPLSQCEPLWINWKSISVSLFTTCGEAAVIFVSLRGNILASNVRHKNVWLIAMGL